MRRTESRLLVFKTHSGIGLRTTGVVRCDQPRALDLAARKGKKLESVPSEIVDEVLARLATILE
ncbi:type II toxin-antitoxin system PemK/MazF family toxin [Allorhizobium terrae]|uniref:type II toxin-antitoxin system PemK/MazF family toxin n=1 Tax=Allorhizobium terrae TaxID=1848972 RepID=UPI0038B40416